VSGFALALLVHGAAGAAPPEKGLDGGGAQAAGTGRSTFEVTVASERVSLRAEGVTLAEVLNRIASSTGMAVHFDDDTASLPVSAHFSDLPLGSALGKILEGRSYSLVYGGGGAGRHVVEVYVLGEGPGEGRLASPPPMHSARAGPGTRPAALPPGVAGALRKAQRRVRQAKLAPETIAARRARLTELMRETVKEKDRTAPALDRFRERLRRAQAELSSTR